MKAIPHFIQPAAMQVISELSKSETLPPAGERRAFVNGGELVFPYRVYYDARVFKEFVSSASGDALLVAQVMGTRHSDGFIREGCISALDVSQHLWTIGFVVTLLGEYVIEVAEAAIGKLNEVSSKALVEFVLENRSLMETTKRRAISYYDAYFRGGFESLELYPPMQEIGRLERLVLEGV